MLDERHFPESTQPDRRQLALRPRHMNRSKDQAGGIANILTEALLAEKLILLTNTAGILDAEGATLSSLSAAQAEQLIAAGTVTSGMLPKMRCALAALAGGVGSVQIINGTKPHALLLEIFTNAGIGTQIT